jgi:uncharacterized protein (DUF2141 family)
LVLLSIRITNNFYINFYEINFVPKSLVNSLSLLCGFDITTINVFSHMKETSMSPRRMLKTFLPALLSAIIFTGGVLPVSAETLIITVRDIRSSDGDIHISVYNSADSFLVNGQTAATQTLSAQEGDVEVVFADLKPGTYAAAAYHDENRSGDFDTNFIGIPREGYGFSNGATAGFGPPDCEDAAVSLSQIGSETDLGMSY